MMMCVGSTSAARYKNPLHLLLVLESCVLVLVLSGWVRGPLLFRSRQQVGRLGRQVVNQEWCVGIALRTQHGWFPNILCHFC